MSRFKPMWGAALQVGLLVCVLCGSASATLLVNPSFETVTDTTATFGVRPNEFGVWLGDLTQIVPAQDGIAPLDGERMLHFIATKPQGASPTQVQSDLYQIIDVTEFEELISSGQAVASASAHFNRVLGDGQTDTEFLCSIHAYAGEEDTFPEQWGGGELAESVRRILTDADLGSWEAADVALALPPNTDFVVLKLAASENVFNDAVLPEFDGHYADAISFSIVPEPTMLASALLAGLAMARRNRPTGCS